MAQAHSLLVSRHNAIALSIVGYLGAGVILALIILAFITKGSIQLATILCLSTIVILIFVMRNPKKLNLFNKIKIER